MRTPAGKRPRTEAGSGNPIASALQGRATRLGSQGGLAPMQIGGTTLPDAIAQSLAGAQQAPHAPAMASMGGVTKLVPGTDDGFEASSSSRPALLAVSIKHPQTARRVQRQEANRGSRFGVVETIEETPRTTTSPSRLRNPLDASRAGLRRGHLPGARVVTAGALGVVPWMVMHTLVPWIAMCTEHAGFGGDAVGSRDVPGALAPGGEATVGGRYVA